MSRSYRKGKNKCFVHIYAEPLYKYPLLLSLLSNYRLITAYLLLRVNLDKIMHAR